jgi:DNA gyrase subunit A
LYAKKVYEIPEAARAARGKALINFLEIGPEETIADIVRIREFDDDEYLVMATECGVVKKTALSAYKNIRSSGIIGMAIDEGDRLIGVKLTDGSNDLLLTTRRGMSIRFDEGQLRNQGRTTRGVRGIRVGDGDVVVGVCVVEPERSLMTITEHGFGKRTAFAEHRVQGRGGKGIIAIQTTARNGPVIGAHPVHDGDALVVITLGGQIVRMPVSDVRVIGRSTQGVRLISLTEDDRLVSATIVQPETE